MATRLVLCALTLLLAGCGRWVSVGDREPAQPPHDECGNGVDDDGDGVIDDGCWCGTAETQPCYRGGYLERGLGACADGVQTCDTVGSIEFGLWGACEGDTGPLLETCENGLDDDCDGAVDEGCACDASEQRECGFAQSREPCRAGRQACGSDGTWSACEGAVGPSPDICGDEVDNDCDGEVDDGCDCDPIPEICGDEVDNDCDGDVDEVACRVCTPSDEVCNGRDDDCDGAIDELMGCDTECVGGSGLVDIEGGYGYTCGLHQDGSVWCWGNNHMSALGTGDPELHDSLEPVRVAGIDDAVELTVGGQLFGCVRRRGGEIWCWGMNSPWGRLGDGTLDNGDAPVQAIVVDHVTDAIEVDAGSDWVLLRSEEGLVYGWGYSGNDSAVGTIEELYIPVSPDPRPVLTPGLADAVQIAAGRRHACAVLGDGTVACWGTNETFESGPRFVHTDFGEVDYVPEPQVVAGLSDVVQVAAGDVHTCALHSTGEVSCWGDGEGGRLGNGEEPARGTPEKVAGIRDATSIEAAHSFTCVVRRTGEVDCWGPAKTTWVASHPFDGGRPFTIQRLPNIVDVTLIREVAPGGCALDACGRVFCFMRWFVTEAGYASSHPYEAIGGLPP